MPSVDIVIPVYNPGPYLESCVRSCLHQTFRDFTLYIIDDASDEDVVSVLKLFGDTRIVYKRNRRRKGIGGNWNAGIGLGVAPYVTVFHQDDLMAPNSIEQKLAMLNDCPHFSFVFSSAVLIDERNIPQGVLQLSNPPVGNNYSGSEFVETCVLSKDVLICCPSVMMRRTVFEQSGGFSERYKFTLDILMWARLALRGPVGYIREPLISHRRHARQASKLYVDGRGLLEEFQSKMQIVDEFYEEDERALWRQTLRNRYRARFLHIMSKKDTAMMDIFIIWYYLGFVDKCAVCGGEAFAAAGRAMVGKIMKVKR